MSEAMKFSQTKADIVMPVVGEVLEAYLQANTNQAIRNSGSRGAALDDAMSKLADRLECGWYRDEHFNWQFGLRPAGKVKP